MKVVTRFAPSPTGILHIGGARTALFNWLFARHHGGRYLLRIEDTDRERSTQPAIEAIHDALAWLGLEGDEPPVMQSGRAGRHAEIADYLLRSGAAYRCYMSDEELEETRQDAMTRGVPVRSPWRSRDEQGEGAFVVRMRMPDDGETVIEDAVQGAVSVRHANLDDMVILRADGTPTYMLAVVADDHDMGITHVIRGDDHLNNAFRQLMVFRAMGWQEPTFAHIPLIHARDGKKMSKRDGAAGVDAYRDMGVLADALFNYLLRLGWSHGDEEIISRENAVAWFDLERVGKSPSRFDIDKLLDVNSHYLRELGDAEFWSFLESRTEPASLDAKARVAALLPLLKERARTQLDVLEGVGFLLHDGPPEIAADASAVLDEDARAVLRQLADDLPPAPWERDDLQVFLQGWLEARGLKMKDVGLPLRAALTGTKRSPSIIDVAAALGREEVLSRIRQTCQH